MTVSSDTSSTVTQKKRKGYRENRPTVRRRDRSRKNSTLHKIEPTSHLPKHYFASITGSHLPSPLTMQSKRDEKQVMFNKLKDECFAKMRKTSDTIKNNYNHGRLLEILDATSQMPDTPSCCDMCGVRIPIAHQIPGHKLTCFEPILSVRLDMRDKNSKNYGMPYLRGCSNCYLVHDGMSFCLRCMANEHFFHNLTVLKMCMVKIDSKHFDFLDRESEQINKDLAVFYFSKSTHWHAV